MGQQSTRVHHRDPWLVGDRGVFVSCLFWSSLISVLTECWPDTRWAGSAAQHLRSRGQGTTACSSIRLMTGVVGRDKLQFRGPCCFVLKRKDQGSLPDSAIRQPVGTSRGVVTVQCHAAPNLLPRYREDGANRELCRSQFGAAVDNLAAEFDFSSISRTPLWSKCLADAIKKYRLFICLLAVHQIGAVMRSGEYRP